MKIILTDDLDKTAQEIDAYKKIVKDEINLGDLEEIKNIAYLTHSKKITVLLCAAKYPVITQNALLKILEEPPPNVDFILIAKSKYALLDTVRSRLPIEKKYYKTQKQTEKINKITNEKILELLQKEMEKEEIIELFQSFLDKDLDEENLKIITDAIKMLHLNIDTQAVLACVLLNLKELS